MFHDPGPGDLAVLGDVTDEEQRRAGGFREAHQLLRAGADLGHGAGRGGQGVGPQRLDGIDNDDLGLFRLQGRENVAQGRRGGEGDRSLGDLQAFGAQPDLGRRFLAGDVSDRSPAPREARRDLEKQRRFPDAGVAADQERRARNQPAAAGAVEFRVAGREARLEFSAALQRGEIEDLALRLAAGTGEGARRGRGLLERDRIPFAAGVAAPGPFAIDRAAGLAYELFRRARQFVLLMF